MSEENSETTVDRKLFEIFEEAFDLNYSFETCNDPTNGPEFQVKFNLRCFCIIVLFNLKCVIYILSNYEIHFRAISKNASDSLKIAPDWLAFAVYSAQMKSIQNCQQTI